MKIYILVLILFAARFLAVHSYLFPDFYTCDFDLIDPKEQWRRYHFSDDCLSIYKRRQYSDTYYLYLAEAHAFKKFTMAIENYEAKKSGKKMCANNEYALNLSERQKFYDQVNLGDCYKKSNKTALLNCLIEERTKLTTIINNAHG
nr:uncharacterized protein LOC106621410 [Bactrocera oleae]